MSNIAECNSSFHIYALIIKTVPMPYSGVNVQQLNIFMNDNQGHFNVLRKINNKPKSTQRELAEELGFRYY